MLAVLGALAMAGLVLVRQGSTKSVLLARGGVVARALQAALREEGRVEQVQSEVATLDRIRDGMTAQLRAVAPARPERVLDAVARDSRQLRAKLDQAARAETKLLQQSEALVDGGCKDHRRENGHVLRANDFRQRVERRLFLLFIFPAAPTVLLGLLHPVCPPARAQCCQSNR